MRFVPPDRRTALPEPSARSEEASDLHVRSRCANGVAQAIVGDAQAIAFTRAHSWQLAYEHRFVPFAPAQGDFAADVTRWAQRIRHGALPVLVALRERAVVGYVALRELPPQPEQREQRHALVESAHLSPAHWQGRVAESLLLAVSDLLTQRGFHELSIGVLTDNTRVQWLLVEHGFQMREVSMRRGRMHTRYALPLRRSP